MRPCRRHAFGFDLSRTPRLALLPSEIYTPSILYAPSKKKISPRQTLSSACSFIAEPRRGSLPAKVPPQPWRLFFPPGSSAVTRPSLLVTIPPFTPAPDNSPGILELPVDRRPGTTFGGHNAFAIPSRGEGKGGGTASSSRASCIATTCTESRSLGQKGARGPSRCSLLPVLFRCRCGRHARDTNCRSDRRRRYTTARHFAQNSDR